MTLKKKIAFGLLAGFVVIQFFQPRRNQSEQITDMHIERQYTVPENVKAIIANACYDCHSDNTRYPWYSNIQPGGWLLANHIKNGKEELNFSRFGEYSKRKQRSKFLSMSSQVEDGKMPLPSYTWIHRNAVLSLKDKEALIAWFNTMADTVIK